MAGWAGQTSGRESGRSQGGGYERYALYGDPNDRGTAVLAMVLSLKGLAVDFIEENASLALLLATRAGSDEGPYLRTPEGFVLSDPHAILEWLERVHPEPVLLPRVPVRRVCARLLEDWIELWLPHWPRRSWATLERLGQHLDAAGFLLGPSPMRVDWLLAAWLETEVLPHEDARQYLARTAPRLVSLGQDLLASAHRTVDPREEEDVLPVSLLAVLSEVGADYHAYLTLNHQALKDHEDRVLLDLGLGKRPLPVQEECEIRRIAIGRELGTLARPDRRRVSEMLEPLGVWHALTLPPALEEVDPADPLAL